MLNTIYVDFVCLMCFIPVSIAQKGIDLANIGLSGSFFILFFLVPKEGDKHFVLLVEIIKSSQGAAADGFIAGCCSSLHMLEC